MSAEARDQRLFYGWYVVAAAFVITFLGFGCAYTFSPFIGPLQKEFGASRGSVSLAFSVAGFLYFALGIISGPLADRWGARRLAVIGMFLIGGGFALVSRATSLTEVYLAYAGALGSEWAPLMFRRSGRCSAGSASAVHWLQASPLQASVWARSWCRHWDPS